MINMHLFMQMVFYKGWTQKLFMELTEPEARGEQAEALRIAKAPEPARAAARLKLNDAVKTVIAEGLDLLGVAAPDRM